MGVEEMMAGSEYCYLYWNFDHWSFDKLDFSFKQFEQKKNTIWIYQMIEERFLAQFECPSEETGIMCLEYWNFSLWCIQIVLNKTNYTTYLVFESIKTLRWLFIRENFIEPKNRIYS